MFLIWIKTISIMITSILISLCSVLTICSLPKPSSWCSLSLHDFYPHAFAQDKHTLTHSSTIIVSPRVALVIISYSLLLTHFSCLATKNYIVLFFFFLIIICSNFNSSFVTSAIEYSESTQTPILCLLVCMFHFSLLAPYSFHEPTFWAQIQFLQPNMFGKK